MIKEIKAALAKVARSGLDRLQAGARSTQGNSLNYASVNTLDPSRLAAAFASADQGFITDQATLFELVEEQDPHIFAELAKDGDGVLMIDATHIKAHRTAASLLKKGLYPAL